MTSQWTYPTIISQLPEVEQHIPWVETKFDAIKTNDVSNFLTTTKELLHISNFTVNDIKMKTYFLYSKGFEFIDLPVNVAGIEVEISMLRGGRITDDTIQLTYNNEFISDNKADYKLNVVTTYGGPTDLWGLTDLSVLSNPEFGIGVRYQSHPSWPHRENPKINYIRIRVW